MIILIGLILIALVSLFGIVQLPVPPVWKFGLGILEMAAVSHILIKRHKLDGEMGLILLRNKKGIEIIDKLAAKGDKVWKLLADSGGFMAYGLMSIFIMRKHFSLKSAAIGLVCLLVLSLFVVQGVAYFLSNVLSLDIAKSSESTATTTTQSIIPILVIVALVIGGWFIAMLGGLLVLGGSILMAGITGGAEKLAQTQAGATLLLPGINLPFFEGIAALVIIMIMHEGAHAILARLAKVPVLSSGIVLFGIIPIGAFIEPDENQLKKTEAMPQSRVLIAGSTSNLMGSILFFILFIIYVAIVNATGIAKLEYISTAAKFVYVTLGLVFSLSFVIGTVNLLPLPFFDGYRLLEVNIPYKNIVKGVMLITVLAFLLNLVPWLFKV